MRNYSELNWKRRCRKKNILMNLIGLEWKKINFYKFIGVEKNFSVKNWKKKNKF